MKLDSIERLQSQAIDYMQKGAAMRLAWAWIAQDHWVRRDYGPVTIKELSHALKDAHACVRVARHHEKQKALADKDPRVVALREQRAMLENKSFRTSIREDQRQIDQQINNIIRELETAQ
jgi:hypothetical protein